MGILHFISKKKRSFPFLGTSSVVTKEDFRGTRLFETWDLVFNLYFRMDEEPFHTLITLLIYGDDPHYGDVIRFLECGNWPTILKKFQNLRDAETLIQWAQSELITQDEPVGLGKRPATPMPFIAESGVADTKIGSMSTEVQESDEQQTMKFADDQDVMILDMSSSSDVTRTGEDYQGVNSLASFLTRPIILSQIQWTPAGNFSGVTNYVDINPWFSYLNDAGITHKVNNYRMLRADGMRLQFRLNGSPFHFGQLYAGYCPGKYQAPYAGLEEPQNQTVLPTNMGTFNATTFPLYTHFSQWPGVFINPATNVVAELDIPFFWPQNYLNTVSSLDFISMGTLKIWAINALQHANGATDPITLTVTGHLINPVLTMPTYTSAFTGESGTANDVPRTRRAKQDQGEKTKTSVKNDEYGKGAISAPATALANFAGTLSKVPVIGPYALATQIAANKMSQVAKIFGYSKPVNIATEMPINYRSFGSLALTTTEDSSHKLTLDPKQEVTVDPVVTGLRNIDEMTFAHIFKRESLIVQFPWSVADLQTTNLVQILVNPANHPANIGTNTIDYHTALSWGISPFVFWRGSLKYRFQIIASQMHRGRLAIVYTPNCAGSATLPLQSESFQEFVDLSDRRDFTVEVKYAHPNPWLQIVSPNNVFVSKGSTSYAAANAIVANGLLQVYVLNELTSPTNTSIVTVNVFISAGDDFMVAEPGASNFDQMTPYSSAISAAYTAQAGTGADFISPSESMPVQSRKTLIINGDEMDTPDVDRQSVVFFGEQAVSLRSLLKRYCYYTVRTPVGFTPTAAQVGLWSMAHPRIPQSRGFTDNNANEPLGFSDTTGPYNFIRTTLIDWYRRGYIANRGSVRYKYIVASGGLNNAMINTLRVYRVTNVQPVTGRYLVFFDDAIYGAANTNTSSQLAYDTKGAPFNSFSGLEWEFLKLKTGIEYEHPWYSSQRFEWNALGADLSLTPDPNDAYSYQFQVVSRSTVEVDMYILGSDVTFKTVGIEMYCAAGEDFSLHYFLAAPVMGFSAPTSV